jgi:hypothetical protein
MSAWSGILKSRLAFVGIQGLQKMAQNIGSPVPDNGNSGVFGQENMFLVLYDGYFMSYSLQL